MAGEKEQEQQPGQEQGEPVQQQQEQQQTQDNQQEAGDQQQANSPGSGENVAAENQSSPTANQTGGDAQSTQQPRPTVHKIDYEQDVVYVYGFCRTAAMPSFSPFALKVETWLRMAGVKYENIDHGMKYWSKKSQLPFVELNGTEIADSAIIIRELSKHFSKDLDSELSTAQRSISHAFYVMLDNHTGWVYRYWWYNHPEDLLKTTKVNLQQLSKSRIPNAFLKILFKLKMRGKKKVVANQGLGVHTAEEVLDFGKADLMALSELLGDKPFFFGDEATLLDCVAFAHLVQMLSFVDVEFPIKAFVESECSNLVALVERIKERYWPDWEEICSTLDLNTHLPKPPPAEDNKGAEKEKGSDEKKKEKEGEGGDAEKEGEKEKVEQDEKEKEKDKEVEDDGDNKKKEGKEEEENKKE